MNTNIERGRLFAVATTLAVTTIGGLAGACSAYAQGASWVPGNLVVSGSAYVNAHTIVAGQTVLPPDCSIANCPTPATAVVGSTYPYVFNNDTVDGSFGITSLIFLDQITPKGELVSTLAVPNSTESGIGPASDQLVTSFSSKSELALNLSTAGDVLTFVGYVAPIGAIDVSNGNTPGEFDSTNPVGTSYYRAVAQVDSLGKFHFTETNAYSGDNGRAAIFNDGANLFYTAGNAGNGSSPQPVGIIIGAGAQIMTPANEPETAQTPAAPTPVGSFNVAQLGDALDKAGKDTNFRGLTIFNNVLYYTKGSGSNGINTVYFVDTTGTVCTDTNGVGLPAPGATLPVSPLAYNPDPTIIQTDGLEPSNLGILKGFPTLIAKSSSGVSYPVGVWFASPTVLYVADEGTGNTGTTVDGFYTPATPAQNPTAGLQKWIFDSGTGQWQLAYVVTNGLGLGVPYTVPGYPVGLNSGAGGSTFPWAPATDGLRNITGIVNPDGNAVIYAITSTISGSGDQGADPNRLVAITDQLSATTLPASEEFVTLRTASNGQVLRGVAWTPGTPRH